MVLALSFNLAFSLERLSGRGRQALIQTTGSRRTYAAAGPVLDRLYSRLLYFLYNPGILLNAGLPCVRVAAWLRHGPRMCLGSPRHSCLEHRLGDCSVSVFLYSVCGAACANTRRHHRCAL